MNEKSVHAWSSEMMSTIFGGADLGWGRAASARAAQMAILNVAKKIVLKNRLNMMALGFGRWAIKVKYEILGMRISRDSETSFYDRKKLVEKVTATYVRGRHLESS